MYIQYIFQLSFHFAYHHCWLGQIATFYYIETGILKKKILLYWDFGIFKYCYIETFHYIKNW